MSFDIKIGTNNSYIIPIDLNKSYKHLVNTEKPITTNSLTIHNQTSSTVTTSDQFVSDVVTAELIDNVSIKNLHVPNNIDWYYIIKYENTYKYVKDKPFQYLDLSYEEFTNIDNKLITDPSIDSILERSLIASRGMIYTTGTTANAWVSYIFPYGGISKSTTRFAYTINNMLHIIKDSDPNIKIDLLEGVVYVNQSFVQKIENIYGFFDIEPVKIYTSPYYTFDGLSKEIYGNIDQKNYNGDIVVNRLTDDSVIIELSFNCFIVPSDPYYISVDGINLMTPRYIPKNTPILVEQKLSTEFESFNDIYIKLFNGIESTDSQFITTSLKEGIASSIEFFSENYVATGLFIFKETDKNSFDTTKSTYLPLFNKQDIIMEQ